MQLSAAGTVYLVGVLAVLAVALDAIGRLIRIAPGSRADPLVSLAIPIALGYLLLSAGTAFVVTAGRTQTLPLMLVLAVIALRRRGWPAAARPGLRLAAGCLVGLIATALLSRLVGLPTSGPRLYLPFGDYPVYAHFAASLITTGQESMTMLGLPPLPQLYHWIDLWFVGLLWIVTGVNPVVVYVVLFRGLAFTLSAVLPDRAGAAGRSGARCRLRAPARVRGSAPGFRPVPWPAVVSGARLDPSVAVQLRERDRGSGPSPGLAVPHSHR